MFSISLTGSLLLICIDRLSGDGGIGQGYVEVIIFLVQLGITSSFVTINVAVLILISVSHRLKLFGILQTLNVLAIAVKPGFSGYMAEKGIPTYSLIAASAAGLVLSLLLSHRSAKKANLDGVTYPTKETND